MEEKETKKNKKEIKKRMTVWEALKQFDFHLKDYRKLRNEKLIKGKKLEKNIIRFNMDFKTGIEIAESESFIWRNEDYVIRLLGEGLHYSLGRIIRDVKLRLSTKNNRVKISKREMLKFLLSLEDVIAKGQGYERTFELNDKSTKKIKEVLTIKDRLREKATKYFIKKLKRKDSEVKELRPSPRIKNPKKDVSIHDKRGKKLL